ncbi:MATE family efflux transporter [Methanobrevibacter sp.]|uniref:MATE family efflux transporter n=1 Tax=Methanobrevibacter sp. TaxID=66852 RepID=UPI0025EB8C9F|nr:MATE family efflux transporter [Methanobrevibacter sp.]MBQ2962337.1 MATE family efflux transporter [Methanobrevibacter sp.]
MSENNLSYDGVDAILGDPKKALWKMSIPLIISLFITSLYSVIDAIWVSGLGADALAGVGFVSPIFIALMGIGNGLGAGSASALSKYIGENNKEKADNGAIHTIFITVIVSIITTILLLIFLKDILLGMGAGSTIDYAMDYGVIMVIGSILVILSNALYGVLRGEGDANRTMYAMLFSSIFNMILDPILIYGLDLGVRGAAIATLISLLLVNAILFHWFYLKKDTYLKPFLSNYKFDKGITIDIIKVGFPASLELVNNALFAALFSLLLVVVANTDAVAVYSTGWRVVTIATTPILAIATALISVVGANYGARKYEEILVAHRYSMKIAIIFGFIAAIVVYAFAPQIVSVFAYTGTSTRLSPQLIAFLSVIVIYFPTMGYGCTSTFVFQGTGNGITAMFQTILRETIFTLGFAILLAIVLGYEEYGAWWGIILGEIVVNTITMVWADWHIKKLIKLDKMIKK